MLAIRIASGPFILGVPSIGVSQVRTEELGIVPTEYLDQTQYSWIGSRSVSRLCNVVMPQIGRPHVEVRAQ